MVISVVFMLLAVQILLAPLGLEVLAVQGVHGQLLNESKVPAIH